jgi:hypothetical protein
LNKYNVLLNEQSKRILMSFYGLTIKPIYSDNDVSRSDTFAFDPIKAYETIDDHDLYLYWSQHNNMGLSLLADISDRAVLMADNAGRIYIIALNMLQYCGEDIVDAMNNVLVFGKRDTVVIHRSTDY